MKSRFDPINATPEQKEAIAWAFEAAAQDLRASTYPFFGLKGKATPDGGNLVLAMARKLLRERAAMWAKELVS